MKIMNGELKRVMDQVKTAQARVNNMIKNQDWMEEARKYADHQRKEVKKLLTEDASKLRHFLDVERREMEKFQKQIPGEIKKFQTFLKGQRKEFQKLVKQIRKGATVNRKVTVKVGKKTIRMGAGTKTQAAKKKAGRKPAVRKTAQSAASLAVNTQTQSS